MNRYPYHDDIEIIERKLFNDWLSRLDGVMLTQFGYGINNLSFDKWIDYYNQGYTPKETIIELMEYDHSLFERN